MWYLLAIALSIVSLILVMSFAWGRQLKKSPKILLLHGLSSDSFGMGGISLQRFEQLLRMIANTGLTVGTPAEALRDRTKIAITFDDGYDDLMQLEPLLRQWPIPITVFIPTAYIGRRNDWDHFLAGGLRKHLSEEQIRALAGIGVRFGTHGHFHRDLTTVGESEIQSELERSREILFGLTGQQVDELAYPFGRSNQRVRELAARLGLTRQFGSSARSIGGESIGRISITRLDNAFIFRGKLGGGFVAGIEALKSAVISRFSHLTPVTNSQSRAA